MVQPAPHQLIASMREGIEGVRLIAARFDGDDWGRPSGCEGWSAADLAGHLLTVARWWHDWLDRAESGDGTPPFTWDELDARTAGALAALPPGTGPARIEAFAERALSYLDRMPAAWDRPFGWPGQSVAAVAPVTVGVHARIAPAEWHLHAWDLAFALDLTYRPREPAIVYEGMTTVFGVSQHDGDAWENALRLSGRGSRLMAGRNGGSGR